ncbi:hypothetical protein ACA910_011966 [Epithemia clementina (nom. ined.)]
MASEKNTSNNDNDSDHPKSPNNIVKDINKLLVASSSPLREPAQPDDGDKCDAAAAENDDGFYFWTFRLWYMNGYLFHEADDWNYPKAIALTMGTMLAYVHVTPWAEDVVFVAFLVIQLYWYYQIFPSLANHSNLHVLMTLVLLPLHLQRCGRHVLAAAAAVARQVKKKSKNNTAGSSSSSVNNKIKDKDTCRKINNDQDYKGNNNNNNVKDKDCCTMDAVAATTITTATITQAASAAEKAATSDSLSSLRCIIVILYFWAGFHKLNTDFFDLQVTCAFEILTPILNNMDPRQTLPLAVQPYLPAVVIAMELLPALFFFFPKNLQKIGILLLLLVHGPLSFVGFADFSSIGMANLFLFVSPRVFQSNWWKPYFVGMTILFVTAQMYFGADKSQRHAAHVVDYAFYEGLLLVAAFGPVWYHYFFGTNVPGPTIAWPKSCWNRFIPLLFIFFGMNNYLGLRTAGTVSMFSNLRTEGPRSNHLLLGANPLKLFDYQEDVVYILDADPRVSEDYRYQMNPNVRVPWIQFCRIVDEAIRDQHHELYVWVEHNGVQYETYDLSYDTNFTDQFQIPWWQRFFLEFREIYDEGEKQICTW